MFRHQAGVQVARIHRPATVSQNVPVRVAAERYVGRSGQGAGVPPASRGRTGWSEHPEWSRSAPCARQVAWPLATANVGSVGSSY